MRNASNKKMLLAPADGSRTAHLQPIIDFLKARGNAPLSTDAFCYYQDGYGVYRFAQPLDMTALRAHFTFPASIVVGQLGIYDRQNFVSITHHLAPQQAQTLSFEEKNAL